MNKTTISVQLCETDFWDVNSTWYTNHPKLTPCFRNTFLVWFPAIVFIIAAIIEYLNIRQARQARLNKIPWNFFNQSRLFVTLLLFLLNVSESIDHISTLYIYQSNYNDTSETSREIILISERQSLIISVLIAPIIQALCFLFLAIIYIKQRKCGLSTSGPIWFYLFIHLICDIFEVYSVITSTQNYDIVVLIIKYVHLPTLAILFLIECRGDTRVIEPDFSSNQPNSPELQASFFSKISFCWVNSLIISGYQHKIEFSNLWKTLSRDKAGLLVPILRGAWLKPTVTGSRGEQYKLSNGQTQAANNIIKVVFKLFWRQMLFAGFLKLMQDSFQYTTPMVLKLFLSFMKTKDDLDWHGYLFAISLLIVQTLQSFFLGNYFLIMQVLGLQVKSMLVGGVYRKSLSLSGSSRLVSTSGEIVNLMAVDSQRFQEVLMYVHLFWSTPFQIILAVVLLYREIGWSVFAGVACMLLLLPSNALLARRIKRSQVSVMKTKDNRVKQMGEVLGGIKVIKLYAWENSFIANLIKLRSNELEKLGQILTLDAITNFLWACSPFVVAVVSFAVYVRADDAHILDAEKAFVSIALFNLLKFPLAMLPQLITTSILAYVSSKRLNQFLNSDEIVRYVTRNEEVEAIAIESGTLCWQPDSNERIEHTPALKDINLHIKPGSFVAVVGQVACGKSSLLAGILGEMYHIAGRFNVCQSMHLAYVPQQAWIQNMTVRDNILFGSSLNDERYRQVLSVCSLEPDLEVLPAGDQSEIGEKGINLSGGQKQRVSLARACYSDADIFLLDDPLSALDSHVAKQVFDKVLSSNTGLLRHKTRVLATNSLFVLPYVDQVVVMENGRIVENGTYKDLMRIKGGQLANIMRQYTGKEEVVVEAEVPIKTSSKSPDQSLFAADKILKSVIPKPSTGKLTEAEKVETGSVNFKVYLKYLNAVSTIWFVIIVLSFISATSFNVAANVWLAVWSSDAEDPTKKSDTGLRNMRLIVYALLGAIQSFTMLSGSLGVAKGAIQAARKLHSGLLNRVMHSPMSFFDTTPIGRILNRFAKDIDVVDSSLPMTFRSFLTCLLQVLSTIFLLVYKFPDFLFIIVPLAIAYYLILKVFIKTTRQLKRLESNTRSPIYSHFSETLLGLSTIRAYDSVDRFVKQSDELVDRNQSCTYPNIMANRWLALRLEFFANTIAASAALFSAYHKSTIGAGIAGLTISYSLSITLTFNWLVRMMSDLETNIVSVERILEYMGNTQEDEWVKKQRPASDWPGQGAIQFQDYSTRYREDMELVLKNLSLNISPREKIGIVGRTGSGKSSLSLSLFRILEPTNGKIVIDRLNILDYGLHDLRSKLTIIPQDPVLFSGSLRFNLDPLNAHTDLDIWRALELAHLKTYVSSLKAGLDYQVSEYAENFSMGQRQLICLARAILRQSKILILDEATASIDLETDSIVQKTIRDTFSHCTIITIAHRLHTILDSDRIMVLDRGCVMELDSPMELISNPNSAFSALARDAGIDLSDIRNSS